MLVGIFGTGRNGSTLLHRLLDGSPDLWAHLVEVNYLSVFSDLLRYGAPQQRTLANAKADPIVVDGTLDLDVLLRAFAVHFDEMERTFLPNLAQPLEVRVGDPRAGFAARRYSAPEFLPELLDRIRSAYDDSARARAHLLFKSIETPYIREYERVFPEMRFVHLLRDPITNYGSLKRTNVVRKGWPLWHHGADELRIFLESRWLPHARFLAEIAAPSDRHLVVRYEDVCGDPRGTVGLICDWLGVLPPPEPDVQTVLGGKHMKELPLNPSAVGVKTPERVVADMAGTFGYSEVVTSRERDFIAMRTRELAPTFGYNSRMGTSLVKLAARWLLPDRWEFVNTGSRRHLLRALASRRWYVWTSLLRGAPDTASGSHG